MYLPIGQDFMVLSQDIVGIFDLDNTSISKHTKQFLKSTNKKQNMIQVSYDLPKSFVVCNNEKVYLTQLSSMTIKKRSIHHEFNL